MAFTHKDAKRSRVSYSLQHDGSLAAIAMIVTARCTVKPLKSTSDSSALSMLIRAAKKYADENKIPSVVIEDGE